MTEDANNEPAPKLVSIEELLKPEFLKQLPEELRAMLSSISFDVRVDLDSVLAKPHHASLLEQIAFAAASSEEAAAVVSGIASNLAGGGLYQQLDYAGQERVLLWVIRGYIPTGDVPLELAQALHGYLPKEG